ncbi:MAG: apolipoprotein N-acyltransferase [Planctomycetes bacterium]|nr:apolipoprotein N-acyltransferase [Planctomycetota bacterium]MBI3834567.1 apolipoprotein N-acyltransferase [Planctomycetota bacterium]
MAPATISRQQQATHKKPAASAAVEPAPSVLDRHAFMFGLTLLSAALQSLIFAPISIWPVAFVALVPWLIVVGGARRAPWVYFYSFIGGTAFFFLKMRWMYLTTGWGLLALSLYLAAYYPLVACPLRHTIRRRRWPLAITAPVIWVGSEMIRATAMSGFPWFFLSHSLYGVRVLIQISDLFGAYAVSFLVVAINGAIADYLLSRMHLAGEPGHGVQPRPIKTSIAFAAIALIATITYGVVQLNRGTISDGPKVVTIQGDYLMSIDGEEADDREKKTTYFAMLQDAASQQADLYLLPETPWIMYLNPEARNYNTILPASPEAFRFFNQFATEHHTYLVTGSASLENTPYDLLATSHRYNSATTFHPDGREPDRYDKVHLVYFGETIPFRFGRFRWLYLWFNRMMPFNENGESEYSLFPGTEFKVVAMTPPSQPQKTYHFGTPICYEDVMPYVSREFVGGGSNVKRADFLLNISNDGWFGRGVQQAQHLAICVFRAVENRVGIVRAVNTGVSGFIDPDGTIHDVVKGDPSKNWPRQCGYSTSHVRVDSRYSLYSRVGDWFGWVCALLWAIVFIDYWVFRARA